MWHKKGIFKFNGNPIVCQMYSELHSSSQPSAQRCFTCLGHLWLRYFLTQSTLIILQRYVHSLGMKYLLKILLLAVSRILWIWGFHLKREGGSEAGLHFLFLEIFCGAMSLWVHGTQHSCVSGTSTWDTDTVAGTLWLPGFGWAPYLCSLPGKRSRRIINNWDGSGAQKDSAESLWKGQTSEIIGNLGAYDLNNNKLEQTAKHWKGCMERRL